MGKKNKYIEIVRSSTEGLSSMGEKSSDMIKGVLEQYYDRVEISQVSEVSDLELLAAKKPDLVFIGVKLVPVSAKRKNGPKVFVSSFLDDNGIIYTGSDSAAIAMDFSKPLAKKTIKKAGIKTPAYFVASHGQYKSAKKLPLKFPLFIKPPNAGGGKGIGADSVIRDFPSFALKVKYISDNFHTDALVEQYLSGREYSVAMLDSRDAVGLVAMPVEMLTDANINGDKVLGRDIRIADTEKVVSVDNREIKESVSNLATKAYKALGARDYGRIDIRLDKKGVPHFIEANLIPGVAYHDFTSYFTAACWINGGMDYKAMILRIVELGLARGAREQHIKDLLEPDVAPAFSASLEPLPI